jgi:hypothetical protein
MVNRDGEQKTDQIILVWCEKEQTVTCPIVRLQIDVSENDDFGRVEDVEWNARSASTAHVPGTLKLMAVES